MSETNNSPKQDNPPIVHLEDIPTKTIKSFEVEASSHKLKKVKTPVAQKINDEIEIESETRGQKGILSRFFYILGKSFGFVSGSLKIKQK
ncbi:MAG: hypothetical protein HQL27_00385 [Candidatus Omnitrophica bacterium]|nr:hypothetical protein [Candidatus Omnitrophota bacterium]